MRAATLVKHKTQPQQQPVLTPPFIPEAGDFYFTLVSEFGTVTPLNGLISLQLGSGGRDLGKGPDGVGRRDWVFSNRFGDTGTICMAAAPTLCMANVTEPESTTEYIRLTADQLLISRFRIVPRWPGHYAIEHGGASSYFLFPGVEGHTLTVKKVYQQHGGSAPTFQIHNVEPIPK